MNNQNIFKRYEKKYLITNIQKQWLIDNLIPYMNPDKFGRSTICNIYFDTPSKLLIRRSIEKPLYKEKLRVRSYGVPKENSPVFVELKKKYDSVVYKRRMDMTESQAMKFLLNSQLQIEPTQILNEISAFFQQYENLAPSVFISYERDAFYSKDDYGFRVSFDENLLWRDYDINLKNGTYGTPLLANKQVIMEVKTMGAMPLWMSSFLSNANIRPSSFSKYGTAYRQLILKGEHSA